MKIKFLALFILQFLLTDNLLASLVPFNQLEKYQAMLRESIKFEEYLDRKLKTLEHFNVLDKLVFESQEQKERESVSSQESDDFAKLTKIQAQLKASSKEFHEKKLFIFEQAFYILGRTQKEGLIDFQTIREHRLIAEKMIRLRRLSDASRERIELERQIMILSVLNFRLSPTFAHMFFNQNNRVVNPRGERIPSCFEYLHTHKETFSAQKIYDLALLLAEKKSSLKDDDCEKDRGAIALCDAREFADSIHDSSFNFFNINSVQNKVYIENAFYQGNQIQCMKFSRLNLFLYELSHNLDRPSLGGDPLDI